MLDMMLISLSGSWLRLGLYDVNFTVKVMVKVRLDMVLISLSVSWLRLG